ncbi:unnamed protein product, partial [Ixodes hexagonus]
LFVAADGDDIAISKESRSNMLGILSVSILLGAILSVTVTESNALLNLFIGLSNASVTISHLIAWYSPVGIFFLVATRATQVQDTGKVYRSIVEYVLTALGCLLLYGLVFLPALYAATTRRDVLRFLRLTMSPMLKAVRTASRAVSMRDTIDVLEEDEELEPRIVRFVIPVGANVSMSGTALVVSVAAVFLAKFNGLELGPEDLIGIGTTALFASLGAASIPNSSVLTLLMILRTLQLPNSDISIVFAADCIIDRFRIAANIFTDSVGSAVVQRFSRLKPLEDSVDDSSIHLPGYGFVPDPQRRLASPADSRSPQGSAPGAVRAHHHRGSSQSARTDEEGQRQGGRSGAQTPYGMVIPASRYQLDQVPIGDPPSPAYSETSVTSGEGRHRLRKNVRAAFKGVAEVQEVSEEVAQDEDSPTFKKSEKREERKRRYHRHKRAKKSKASSVTTAEVGAAQADTDVVPPSRLTWLEKITASSAHTDKDT